MAHECSLDGTPSFGLTACYGHLKQRALAGESLTEDELDFIGLTETPRHENWRPAGLLARMYDTLRAEDQETFRAIVELPAASQIDFLG